MQIGKWIDGITPNDAASEVAQRFLGQRLSAVDHFLPLAAEHADEDDDYVHELRVYARRSMAALRLFKEMFTVCCATSTRSWTTRSGETTKERR